MDIGRKINYYRIKRNMTQQELAHGICSKSYLRKIENNKTIPNQEILKFLFEKLDISFDETSNVNAKTINDRLFKWYETIKNRDIEKAKEEEMEIRKILDFSQDPSIIADYHLFMSRYYMLENNFKETEGYLNRINVIQSHLTMKQKYYFYIFKAMYNYLQDDFIGSLENCILAKKIDKKLGINEAELYFLLALTHSRLHHISSAINYSEIALIKFNESLNYIKIVETIIILAINNIRRNKFEEAKLNLEKSLELANKINNKYLISNIKHNLGYLYSEMHDHETSIKYYLESLNEKHKESEVYLNSLYYLSKEYLANKDQKRALEIIDEGIRLSKDINSEFNQIRFRTLKYKITNDTINYQRYLKKETIPYFIKQENWMEVTLYARDLAKSYSEKSKFKDSNIYYELALESLFKEKSEV